MTGDIYGIPYNEYTYGLSMTIGALFAALTVSSLFGFLAKEWKEVKIVVIAEIVWLVGSLISHIIYFSVPEVEMAVIKLIISILFLVLFLLVYLQQEEIVKTLWK